MADTKTFGVRGDIWREGRDCFLLGAGMTLFFGLLLGYGLMDGEVKGEEWIAVGGLSLLIAGGLWLTLSGVRGLSNPQGHVVYREMREAGLEPLDFEQQVEQAQRVGSFVFLADGLYDAAAVRFSLYRDLMWMYQKVVKKSMNGVHVVTTEHLVVHRRRGGIHGFNGSGTVVQGIMAILAVRCPWIVTGYSAALEAKWNNQHQEFIASVDQSM
jgi:hypothetical protein